MVAIMAIKHNAIDKTSKANPAGLVTVRLDRIQFLVCPCAKGLPSVPDFTMRRDFFVRPQTRIRTYNRVRILECHKTGTKIYIQHSPACPWLAPAKVTVIAGEGGGLSREELEGIAGSFRQSRLLLVEIAFDFATNSQVDYDFTRAHAYFGKSRPLLQNTHGMLRFGARKSLKFVRAYDKGEVNAFRIELQLNSAFVRRHHIYELEDLVRLPAILFFSHIAFVSIDWERLDSYLRNTRDRTTAKTLSVEIRSRKKSLHQALRHLRKVGVLNTHRFLRHLSLNRCIQNSFHNWAQEWRQTK